MTTKTKITKKKLQELVTQQITSALTEEGPEPLEAEKPGGTDPHDQAITAFVDYLMKSMTDAKAASGSKGISGQQRTRAAVRYDTFRQVGAIFRRLFG